MFCKLLRDNLDKMPGDLRTQIGFITFNSTVHFYSLKVGDFHIIIYWLILIVLDCSILLEVFFLSLL